VEDFFSKGALRVHQNSYCVLPLVLVFDKRSLVGEHRKYAFEEQKKAASIIIEAAFEIIATI
jgi:hypothetical protein